MKNWEVVAYSDGKCLGSLAGLGRNKGTWDTSLTKRTAQRHAQKLRKEPKSINLLTGKEVKTIYKVERSS